MRARIAKRAVLGALSVCCCAPLHGTVSAPGFSWGRPTPGSHINRGTIVQSWTSAGACSCSHPPHTAPHTLLCGCCFVGVSALTGQVHYCAWYTTLWLSPLHATLNTNYLTFTKPMNCICKQMKCRSMVSDIMPKNPS